MVGAFVETLRHLVFAIDKWFSVPILDEAYHRIGVVFEKHFQHLRYATRDLDRLG